MYPHKLHGNMDVFNVWSDVIQNLKHNRAEKQSQWISKVNSNEWEKVRQENTPLPQDVVVGLVTVLQWPEKWRGALMYGGRCAKRSCMDVLQVSIFNRTVHNHSLT